MNKLIIAGAASALIIGSSPAALAATSSADCQTLFDKADVNRDGALQSNEASMFLNAMTQAQAQPQDASKITADEFMVACQKDAFATIDPSLGTAQSSGTADPAAGSSAASQTTSQSQQDLQADQSITSPAGFMVSNLIGANVTSQSGEKIGDIKDVVLSPQGEATHVIVDVGDKDVEVDRSKLKISATENGLTVVLNATQADLAQLPAVNTTPNPPATSQEASGTGETTTTTEQSSTTEQPAASEQTEVSDTITAPRGFMASNLIGAAVKNASDEKLGEIKDIVFSNQGEPSHVIIDIGDKDVEVEKSKLDISASEDGLKVVLNGTQAELAQLPGVNIKAPEQQAATTTTQPAQETSSEPATTGEQMIAPDEANQQATTTEQPAASGTTSTEAQAPSAEQPAASGTTSTEAQAPSAEQPAASSETPSTEQATSSQQPEAPAETSTAAVEQPTTGETPQAQPGEQALAIPDGLMVSDVIGATVYSPSDEKLGEINDLALSSGAGQPPRVIIGVGGFFGIGEKDAPVDMSRLKFTTTEDGLKIVLDATKQDLENLAASSAQ